MYLTAHWVRGRDDVRHLNAVLYVHEGSGAPSDLWSRSLDETLDIVTKHNPGRRVAARFDTIPGGNSVESFLDVVAPDNTSFSVFRRALDVLRDALSRGSPRERIRSEGVSAEFSVVRGEDNRMGRFDELRAAALELLQSKSQPSWMDVDPLTIDVTREGTGLRFRLAAVSEARLASTLSATAQRRTVRITDDVRHAFEQIHGSILPHVGEWVTGLSRADLLDIGGVQFVESGTVIATWPVRSATV